MQSFSTNNLVFTLELYITCTSSVSTSSYSYGSMANVYVYGRSKHDSFENGISGQWPWKGTAFGLNRLCDKAKPLNRIASCVPTARTGLWPVETIYALDVFRLGRNRCVSSGCYYLGKCTRRQLWKHAQLTAAAKTAAGIRDKNGNNNYPGHSAFDERYRRRRRSDVKIVFRH